MKALEVAEAARRKEAGRKVERAKAQEALEAQKASRAAHAVNVRVSRVIVYDTNFTCRLRRWFHALLLGLNASASGIVR